MLIMLRRFSIIAILLSMAALPTWAVDVPIANAGFEQVVLPCDPGPNCYSLGIPGWTATNPASTFKPSTGPGGIYPGGVPEGVNVAAIGDGCGPPCTGTLTQLLAATLQPNTTYTLVYYLGARADYPLPGYNVELLAGSTTLASDSSLTPASGTFVTGRVVYSSSNTNPALLGQAIGIRLTGNAGGQANFDKISLDATPTAPTLVTRILPQLAFGGGWYTALYFTNMNAAPVSFTVSFSGNDGNPLVIPTIGGSSVFVNLAARGTALIEAPNVGSLVQGYVGAALPTGVAGYGIFRQSVLGVPDQEAVVPLSGNTATTSTLLFDDTKYVTGVAVVNLGPVNNTIMATARDNQGNIIGTGTLSLGPNAKTALVLRNIPGLAAVAGAVGSVDLTAGIGNVAALGLRFNGTAFSSIPTSDR
jgi:hypothetical protein